jgi:hypothetical protein
LAKAGEITDETLVYWDDATGNRVSSKWGELPERLRSQIKGAVAVSSSVIPAGAAWGVTKLSKLDAPDDNKAKFPENDSQTKHIFRDAEGHLSDTTANRQLLTDTVKSKNFSHSKGSGVDVYKKLLSDGRQVWVEIRNGVIQNGGINNVPK